MSRPSGAVDLYWIPLGAGAHVVRISGKVFEAVSASVQRRERCDLYHSALEVHVPGGRYVIEQAPVPDLNGERRGVVAEGPVGTRVAGHFRLFRYEIRRWRDGDIPDVRQAIGSPVRVTDDAAVAQRILDLLPSIPTPVWGRDEFHAGEMWNSNSVVSWVLTRSGADISAIGPPRGGRAPGWHAGLVIGARDERGASSRRNARDEPLPAVAAVISFIDAINLGDVERLGHLMTDDHELRVFDEPPVRGKAANVDAWRGYASAFPHYVIYPHRVAERQGEVAVLGHTSGSHLGLADDEERTLLLIWKARVDQGRLRSWELVLDTAQQRRQLGLE